MNKKICCGRLVMKKDGSMKKVILAHGGGTRDFMLTHIDMGFNEIHDKLREIFSLDDPECLTKLYDFQWKELDTNRYQTFFEYVQKRGLKFRGAIIYIGPSTDNDTMSNKSPEKRQEKITTTVTTRSSTQVVRRLPQVEANLSTPSVLIKIRGNSPPHDSILNNRTTNNLQTSSSISLENYSFQDSLNLLINYLHHLINESNQEHIFILLLEYICKIDGLASITLDRLKEKIGSVEQHEKVFYTDALAKIQTLSCKVKGRIELNKMNIAHNDPYSVVIHTFNEFYQNLNMLHDQWNRKMDNDRQNTSYSTTNYSITSTISSSTNYSTDPISSTDYSVDPVASTSFAAAASSSSSRKHARVSSPSPHRSWHMSNEEYNPEQFSLFRDLLRSFHHLSDVLQMFRFTNFIYFVRSIIREITNCRSTINLFEYESLYDAEKLIRSIEGSFADRINDEQRRRAPHGISPQLDSAFNRTLDAIKDLLTSIDRYRSQIINNKRPRRTCSSSNEPSSSEQKPMINSNQQQHTRFDDDQSSEASRSSFGDDVLMEVARDAYEQRSNRF